jgi:hypothetical protein
MNIFTLTQAADAMGVSRQKFHACILPLLVARGEAQQVGNTWIIDGKDFWMWTAYAKARRQLIDAGVWIARRPWSIEDMEGIALDTWDYEL